MTDQAQELGSDTKPDHVATPQQTDHHLDQVNSPDKATTQTALNRTHNEPPEVSDSKVEAEATSKNSNDPVDEVDARVAQSIKHNQDGEQDKDGDRVEEEGKDDENEDGDDDDDESDDDDEESENDEDEEPSLKISRLTPHLNAVYRNGDATSAFLVAGDKMIIGTHNGNIHVLQLPTFQPLRVYHAHSASVTSISISPYPPPLPSDQSPIPVPSANQTSQPRSQDNSPAAVSKRSREPVQIPKIPSNDIHIATSSMDGNVCVQSLIDMKDVQLRNFGRPVQSVALSPEFKSDRSYISGGLAGQLILTSGGGPGRSTSTTIGTAAAAASGWLGSMGLGSNTGKDTVLHSGEGTINTIKWSLSGKYVVWLNEQGIKIMRSKLHHENAESDDAWKRVGHIDRPQTEEWDTMASVWKGRAEWIDEKAIESDEAIDPQQDSVSAPPAADRLKGQSGVQKPAMERLLVGWGAMIWIINVHPDGSATKSAGNKAVGRAEIAKILRIDCIISGISLYTSNLLLVLAFSPPEDGEDEEEGKGAAQRHRHQGSTSSAKSEPSGGVRKRQNNLPPELRLIDLVSQAEVDKEELVVSRYERLLSADYHLGVLPARSAASVVASKGALETIAGLGSEMWNAAINPRALFSSGASIRSRDSGDDFAPGSRTASTSGTIRGGLARPGPLPVHPSLSKPGAKIFVHSPYDCILATKRDLSDHLAWLLEHEQYSRAWELLDENPEILADKAGDFVSTPAPGQSLAELFEDESVADSISKSASSAVEKEKQRIGELWVKELIDDGQWDVAAEVCSRVLHSPDRWEKWVWTFAGAKKFDEITNYIPSAPMRPPIPTTVYEVVLGHYIHNDKPRFRDLLDLWSPELFDIKAVTTALENQLKFRDVRQDSIDGGEKGRDWRIVHQGLARLYETGGRQREALKCYIKLQDADSVFRLIRDNHLAEAVADDIPGFISLRVPAGGVDRMTKKDLANATSDAITLLVDEAQHGLVGPRQVVEQLQAKKLRLYLFFYLRGLWHGDGVKEHGGENRDHLVLESRALVDDFADLVVTLFATYERSLLMDFLKTSTAYTFDKAVEECEQHKYYDELVFLYSKTGQMKRALYLIIDRLRNVEKAIEFVKEQDDPDLWNDLLDYSMDKPSFIRALLEQVGTAINPITLVRRIPEGLEIEGLREGLTHMMKEHELQHSISSGAATVMRSEVGLKQRELRAGQRRGVKFEPAALPVNKPKANQKPSDGESQPGATKGDKPPKIPKPGHCVGCGEAFTEYEMETLVGYACGHVYHVSHLMEMMHGGGKVDIDIGGDSQASGRYLVGMKVMKARLLRDKMQGGCPVCHSAK
ncbi:Tetratricopeptide-like helical [Cordyceps fumosorosea ARSEF 2679]|uniref:Tetratricopeptide-like helical n=1 Tax=Cordyceps fumosorosea (strain ARSEF 2679) TaxID=1081104 RepID=A0A168EA40_CORFA|nr:Tetratricopeptide-like helical [Cordyceps fumosorosea ARSEF 2679]OAA73563.1 Tetratricopeptide-like helical [Cordyceps fumosorosea ARSEF 2679]